MAAATHSNTANFGAIRGARCRPTGHAVGSPVASRAISTVIRAVGNAAAVGSAEPRDVTQTGR